MSSGTAEVKRYRSPFGFYTYEIQFKGMEPIVVSEMEAEDLLEELKKLFEQDTPSNT